MSKLLLKVGVALDSDAKNALQPLLSAMRQVRTSAQRDGAAAGKAFSDPQARAAKEQLRAMQQAGREANRVYQEQTRAAEKAARERVRVEKAANAEIERDIKRLEREKTREVERSARERVAKERAVQRNDDRASGARSQAIRSGVVGAAATALGFGARITSDLLQGAGFKMDLGDAVSKGVQQEKVAQQIVNAGYMPGEYGTAAGELQNKGDIMAETRRVATSTGTDRGEVLGALSAFVGKTGDLDTGRKSLEQMAQLARATGSSLEDVANAAGEVSNNLGDVPDKANATLAVMRSIAGQGKLGAVEMKDLASQMAKLASAAPKFAGDTTKTIEMMGVLAQEAKLRGGAASATNAATSVSSLVSNLTQGSTIANWKKAGLNMFADKDQTQLKSADVLIREALQKSDASGHGANLEKLKELFPNAQGFRAVSGFASVYNQAGGGEAGMKALDEEFRKLSAATLTEAEVSRAFSASMNTTEAKVAVFNSKVEETGQQLAAVLLPAVIEMGPALVATTKDIVEWVAKMTGHEAEFKEQRLKDVDTELATLQNITPQTLTDTQKIEPGQLPGPYAPGEGLTMPGGVAEYDPRVVKALERKGKLLGEKQQLEGELGQQYKKKPDSSLVTGAAYTADLLTFGGTELASRQFNGGKSFNETLQYKYAGGKNAEQARERTAGEYGKHAEQTAVSVKESNLLLGQIRTALDQGFAKVAEAQKTAGKSPGGPSPAPGTTPSG